MMIINQLIQIGEALNIDLRDFYKQLYTIILSLSLNPNIDSKKRRAEMVENDNDESNDDDNNDDNDDDDSDNSDFEIDSDSNGRIHDNYDDDEEPHEGHHHYGIKIEEEVVDENDVHTKTDFLIDLGDNDDKKVDDQSQSSKDKSPIRNSPGSINDVYISSGDNNSINYDESN